MNSRWHVYHSLIDSLFRDLHTNKRFTVFLIESEWAIFWICDWDDSDVMKWVSCAFYLCGVVVKVLVCNCHVFDYHNLTKIWSPLQVLINLFYSLITKSTLYKFVDHFSPTQLNSKLCNASDHMNTVINKRLSLMYWYSPKRPTFPHYSMARIDTFRCEEKQGCYVDLLC